MKRELVINFDQLHGFIPKDLIMTNIIHIAPSEPINTIVSDIVINVCALILYKSVY